MSEDLKEDPAECFSSEEYKKFILEIIDLYKEHPILWDKKHPCFRKNALRDKSWDELFKKFVEYYPDPTMEFMKEKIENLRTVLKREYKKVQDAKRKNTHYKPHLFYYDAFQFIIGHDEDEREDFNSPEYRQFVLEFIECYKQHPILWNREHHDFWSSEERKASYKVLFKKFLEFYPNSTIEIMKGKIENLKGRVQKQYKKVLAEKKEDTNYQPFLFYYDALLFAVKENTDLNSDKYKKFVIEFLTLFKRFRILWDKEHPDFARPAERVQPYNELYLKFLEFYPKSTLDEMKEKLENFKTCFHRVHKKVKAARKTGVDYKPNLFYYNLLLFTVGEEEILNFMPQNIENHIEIEQPFQKGYLHWPREHTAALIELMKKYPETYETILNKTETTRRKKMEAFKNLTMDLMAATDTKFKTNEVKKKVRTLKDMFRTSCLNSDSQGNETDSWLFEQMAEFLPTAPAEKKEKYVSSRMKRKSSAYIGQDSDSNSSESENSDSDTSLPPEPYYQSSKRPKREEENLSLVQLRTTIATKLREMPDDQRQYAEQLISEVMYSGMMEKLTGESTIQF